MVAAALEALVGGEPDDDAVAVALATIPAPELPDALRGLVREHGVAALPVLRRCLAGRSEWVLAAATALGTLAVPEAAETLAALEPTTSSKAVRTAVRRALYRLRQAGIAPAPRSEPPRAAPPQPQPSQAWASAVDGTGSWGIWLVLEGPLGERTLLSAVLNDMAGVLDFAGGPIAKKRLDERLQALRRSAVPWVAVPPHWALGRLAETHAQNGDGSQAGHGDLTRWLGALALPELPAPAPIYARVPAGTVTADPTLLDHSGEILALPELRGWFLDPPSVHADAVELLQTKASRLVVSDQIKAERVAALVDHVIDAQFTPETRRRWQRRLEDTAFVLFETGRPTDARRAVAAAQALADPERAARHIPLVRALVERSLDVAGEVALGRLPAHEASRAPQPPRSR